MPIDTNSETWRTVSEQVNGWLASARSELERPGPHMKGYANQLRGQIAICRAVLALTTPPKPPPVITRDDHAMSNTGQQF